LAQFLHVFPAILTMKFIIIWFCLLFCAFPKAQTRSSIETADIRHFWYAFDMLENAKSFDDSVTIIQREYINKATPGFREFIRLRNLTAQEYARLIRHFPGFWRSIRNETLKVSERIAEIEDLLDKYETSLPNFKQPDICFAIGCLRTGGTISGDLILIGTEIAASTPETDTTRLSPWLKSVIGQVGDIVDMVAHETIHTQQREKDLKNLAEFALNEGIADFLSEQVTGLNINRRIHAYGLANDCTLKKEFLMDYQKDKKDITGWLYNGNKAITRPADLGYYIGYRIAEDYYTRAKDKQKALADLLDTRKYMKIFNTSSYLKSSCPP
jgi:hypothetical protein